MEVAKTSLTGKSAGAVKSFLADICVRAVNSVGTIEDSERLGDLSDIKVEKITEEQLKELQGHVNTINQAQLQLGQLESQKHTLVNAIPQLQKGLKEFQDKMEEEYGKVSINIQDGTIQEIPEDEQANT